MFTTLGSLFHQNYYPFARESFSSRSEATSIMQGKECPSAGQAPQPSSLLNPPGHPMQSIPGHAGHEVSQQLILDMPKAMLGSQQGWSGGVPERSPFADCTRIISMSRGKEGLAQ